MSVSYSCSNWKSDKASNYEGLKKEQLKRRLGRLRGSRDPSSTSNSLVPRPFEGTVSMSGHSLQCCVGNGRHWTAYQSKIQYKFQSTVQSMSPESRFYTYPLVCACMKIYRLMSQGHRKIFWLLLKFIRTGAYEPLAHMLLIRTNVTRTQA